MKDKLVTLIAGPTDRTKIYRFSKIMESEYNPRLESIAKTLIKRTSTVNVIPDQGVPLDLARKFREEGGLVVGYVPHGGSEDLEKNFKFCDEIREIDGGWSILNTCLSLKGDFITTIGMSSGTIVEIAYTKYHNKYVNKKIPVLVDELMVHWRIPNFISEDIDLRYFSSMDQLAYMLNKISGEKK